MGSQKKKPNVPDFHFRGFLVGRTVGWLNPGRDLCIGDAALVFDAVNETLFLSTLFHTLSALSRLACIFSVPVAASLRGLATLYHSNSVPFSKTGNPYLFKYT